MIRNDLKEFYPNTDIIIKGVGYNKVTTGLQEDGSD